MSLGPVYQCDMNMNISFAQRNLCTATLSDILQMYGNKTENPHRINYTLMLIAVS